MGKGERIIMYSVAVTLALTSIFSLVMGVIHTTWGNWGLAVIGYFTFALLGLSSLFPVWMVKTLDNLLKG